MSNYTLTIKSVLPGTDGSTVGHAWITISDGVTSTSYGYYPKEGFDGPLDLLWGDPGEVKKNHDDSVYKTRTILKRFQFQSTNMKGRLMLQSQLKVTRQVMICLGLTGVIVQGLCKRLRMVLA